MKKIIALSHEISNSSFLPGLYLRDLLIYLLNFIYSRVKYQHIN